MLRVSFSILTADSAIPLNWFMVGERCGLFKFPVCPILVVLENCGPLSVLRISGVSCLANCFWRQLITATVDEIGEDGLVSKSRKNSRL